MKTVIHCAPFVSILFIIFNTMFCFLTYLELRLVQCIIKSVFSRKETFFFLCFIGLIICYIMQNAKSSLLQIFKENIQIKLASKEYRNIYNAISNLEITDLDNSDWLMDIQRAKQAVENKFMESFLIFCDIIGVILNLLAISGQLLNIRPVFLMCFFAMAVLQKKYNYYNSLDKVRLEKSINPLFRSHRYFLDLFINKEMNKEIRSYQLYEWIEKKRSSTYADISSKQLKQSKKWICINGLVALMMYLLEFTIYLFVILESRKSTISIDQVIFILESNGVFISYFILLMDDFRSIAINNVYIDSFTKVVNITKKESVSLPCLNCKNVIELKDVNFSYRDDRIAVQDINLEVKKGEKIALLGENGSGKSTLVKIIVGLLRPDSGQVYVNGQQSIVFQDFAKFKFTVGENVFFGNLDEREDTIKVVNSLLDVGAERILYNLPNGLETELSKEFSEKGIDLSGGEWQKIAISRGIFRNAEIIVMDEPTAALDPIAEINQLETLNNIFKELSVIIVSHRVSVAKKADRILFIKDGKIVENGSFEQLMSAKGDFFEFYNMQSKWYK